LTSSNGQSGNSHPETHQGRQCSCLVSTFASCFKTFGGLDVWFDQLPESEEDVAADKLSRDKLILCLENDTLLLVEEHVTTHQALEALRSDHLGHMRSQRSQIMGEVTRMSDSVNAGQLLASCPAKSQKGPFISSVLVQQYAPCQPLIMLQPKASW
jgi:hypothetical protein